MERIYLDYAASTPLEEGVLRAMEPYFTREFGNPGSFHSFGQRALAAVDVSREAIAKFIGASFRDIIFTGSATEANNLILRGVLKSRTHNLKPHVIVSATEHESILETARDLERERASVTYLPVDAFGLVDPESVRSALRKETALVSIMYANNEIGAIEPICNIAAVIKKFRSEHPASRVLFHTDASQAFQFLNCDVKWLGVDAMTLSAHKIYGPKGIGALYIKEDVRKENLISSVVTGGGQEYGFRSGTENVPLVVGFAEALRLIGENKKSEADRIARLRSRFWRGLKTIIPEASLNGIPEEEIKKPTFSRNIPNIINVFTPKEPAEALLTKLDLAGIAAGTGSACRSRSLESSHVLRALYPDTERPKRSIRFSFGRPTTEREIDKALDVIRMIL